MIRDKKKKPNPALTTADTVAVTHLVACNIFYFIGTFTHLLGGPQVKDAGREIIYGYIDYPIFKVLEKIFEVCGEMFSNIPYLSFIGPWFDWFFLESDDIVFRIMHAEFVIVISSLVYGVATYFIVKLFLIVFGLNDD